MKTVFSENLIKCRKVYGWTQHEAAFHLGIQRGTYAAYEEGRSNPPLHVLTNMAKVFRAYDLYAMINDRDFQINQGVPQQPKETLSLVELGYLRLPLKMKKIVDLILEQ